MSTAVVVIGGETGTVHVPDAARAADCVVAADSGYDLALRVGLEVDLLVGDLDSISSDGLGHARTSGVAIEAHEADKDATDLELALDVVADTTPTRLIALGNNGGRLDHQFAAAAALAEFARRHERCAVELHSSTGSIWFVHDRWAAVLPLGSTVSLVPWGGDAVVTFGGVRWPLSEARLAAGTTRGVSNEVLDPSGVALDVDVGLVLLIVPHPQEMTC